MDSFAVTDSIFDFMKHHNFPDEEIKEAMQKKLEGPTSPFTMPDSASFDYNSFFGDELKAASSDAFNINQEEDQPVPSIESGAAPTDPAVTTQGSNAVETPGQKAPVTINSVRNDHLPPTRSSVDFSVMSGLKSDSVDPLLFNFDNLDDIFMKHDQTMPQFEESNLMPTLASPFQPPEQRADRLLDFTKRSLDTPHILPPHANARTHNLLVPAPYPIGRRRSQTVPPDFKASMSNQRHMFNMAHAHSMLPHMSAQSFPPHSRSIIHSQDEYGSGVNKMGIPHAHPPIAPAPHPSSRVIHQDYMSSSRPQSLNPEMRINLINRTRDVSPDRGRRVKRQKQSHERPLPPAALMQQYPPLDLDIGAYGMDQTMAAVEFLLRGTAERTKYGKDNEIEKARSDSRCINSGVSSLDTPLAAMASREPPPMELPKTGVEIKKLNTQGIQGILDFFDIPFVSTMFLHDKKLLYLNFIGACGTLKHLVLD